MNKKPEFNKPLRVLVIEDNQVDRKMLEAMLTEKINNTSFLKVTNSLGKAMTELDDHEFDLAILDLNLPDSKGINSLIRLRQKDPNVAIVVNTGAYEDELGLETLGHGAQDFLVKGKYSAYVLNKVLHYALERKRLERELRDAYLKLKQAQSQLVQSEKFKVIGGLASGIAHEVKNPLATILYGVKFLKDHRAHQPEKVEKVLDNIEDAANKANTIISDLLNFSSITKLKIQKCNIEEIIDKSIALVHHELEKYHIKLIKDITKGIPEISLDGNRIEQVCINVLLNSVYAMPKGGEINIRAVSGKVDEIKKELKESINGKYKPDEMIVMLKVEDTGAGIPEDKLNNIFDPFYTTRRTEGGVGLGLSVSKNIMEIHEGSMILENQESGGARAVLIFKAS